MDRLILIFLGPVGTVFLTVGATIGDGLITGAISAGLAGFLTPVVGGAGLAAGIETRRTSITRTALLSRGMKSGIPINTNTSTIWPANEMASGQVSFC